MSVGRASAATRLCDIHERDSYSMIGVWHKSKVCVIESVLPWTSRFSLSLSALVVSYCLTRSTLLNLLAVAFLSVDAFLSIESKARTSFRLTQLLQHLAISVQAIVDISKCRVNSDKIRHKPLSNQLVQGLERRARDDGNKGIYAISKILYYV